MRRLILLSAILFQFLSMLTGEKVTVGTLHMMAQNQTCELDDIVVIGHQTDGDDDDYDPDDLWNEGMNIGSDGSGENSGGNEGTNWYDESSYNQDTSSNWINEIEIYNESDSIQMMQNDRRRLHDLVVPKGNRTTMETRKLAMKFMVIRSRYTNKEVAAAFLENGDVVIYHDSESTYGSSFFYYSSETKNGEYKEYYKNGNKYYPIKTYVHTHPHTGCDNYNSLCISAEDIKNANRFNGEINILLLDGSFYRQDTESSESTYIPNYRGNIYDNTFSY